jgi:hypothetical protein
MAQRAVADRGGGAAAPYRHYQICFAGHICCLVVAKPTLSARPHRLWLIRIFRLLGPLAYICRLVMMSVKVAHSKYSMKGATKKGNQIMSRLHCLKEPRSATGIVNQALTTVSQPDMCVRILIGFNKAFFRHNNAWIEGLYSTVRQTCRIGRPIFVHFILTSCCW